MRKSEILSRLDGVKDCGNGKHMALCPCPNHKDKTASLSIGDGENGGVVINCFGGCKPEDVVASIGLTMRDLMPDQQDAPTSKPEKKIVAVYKYVDLEGRIRHEKVRYAPKSFIQRHMGPSGCYVYNLNGVALILYNLPAVVKAEMVFVTEGEKDANALIELGLCATTQTGGAGRGKWSKYPQYTEALTGKIVIILPDNDPIGMEYAREIADSVHGKAALVKIITRLPELCPELPEHGDVSDVIAYYRREYGADGDEYIREALLGLATDDELTPVYAPNATATQEAPQEPAAQESGVKALADLSPEKNKRYGWTDIGNGNLFADWFKDRARYVPERKKWFTYQKGVWRPDVGDLKIMQLCKQLADALTLYALSLEDESIREDYLNFVRKWQRRSYRETVLKDAASVYPVEISMFDRDPYIFNCTNGTLNLKTGKFYAHRPEDFLSKMGGVAYDPTAKCECWLVHIDEIMSGEKGKARFLQKSLGYSLTGDTRFECFFILYGPTSRNGKGTTMETHMCMMGDYGISVRPDTIAQRQTPNGSGPSEDVARLAGPRFANVSEPDKRMVISAALVKTLTGNDSITARYLHENSFEFRPQFKLFINSNHLPAVTDVTLFSSGRVKLIPFDRHFADHEQNKGLKAELAKPENLSGILNWCIEGLRAIETEGFDAPESVLAATDEYRKASDKIGRFLDEALVKGPNFEISTSDAYRLYSEWCPANGHHVENMQNFKASIENAATVRRKRPEGAGRSANAIQMILGYREATPFDNEKAGNF